MVGTLKTSISIPRTLFDQAEMLAQRLNISRNHLFEIAIERFIKTSQEQPDPKELSGVSYPDAKAAAPIDVGRLVINQGDIYWVQLDDPNGLEPGIPHPHVVIQENIFNHSRIHTVVVCALTSNIKRASIPGNVLLEGGEANLSRPSVVEASKVSSIDKMQLGEYIGSLSEGRINQIVAGMRFLHRSFFAR